MKIRQIRNATLVIEYGGVKFLVDPWLAPKDSMPAFPGCANPHLRQPTAPLPAAIEEIVDVDAVILTHIHSDHWDHTAAEHIPADMPIFVQHATDRVLVSQAGSIDLEGGPHVRFVEGKAFTDVRVLTGNPQFKGVKLKKVPGQHGSDEALGLAHDALQEVCGIVFSHPDEKILYLAGDTVWNEYVEANIRQYQPDVIIVNAGDAQAPGLGSIIMNNEDVCSVCAAAPSATIIASHLEAAHHALNTRAALRRHLTEAGLLDRVLIPADGETCTV
ncbi:hypothetical protein ASE17_19215 [Phenylobacterium sp. Root77]|uniref:MBL fold metallo-hydrolase n=1 Tax=unclassified Phenylobacterium TaxID=2640670 RepID=UPI0007002886|nr:MULTISPECIES: MBL fold metallo-hydrolase [unclassified Phenylobacterium]KQW65527.1 hypothetical protein ASC73_20305 [Phenylobacterium sp. Root1277]KQW94212.1 hypothetical protein ASC79_00165 [Phenylobacterium sp. Root1290]KRC38986.1 hypothetical protein ASE17_19215 [Phenylobacterium sp. Root77]